MGDAFTDGALGGAMSSPGAGTPSKAINDMVENVVTTTTGGGLSAMRSFSRGDLVLICRDALSLAL